jgi:hypothetical protein
LVAAGLLGESGLADVQNRQVEFNRDIRPILSDYCYTCHGPDKANRTTALRFDTQEGAFADLGGHRAIVPGDLAKSEMVRRITAADEAVRMPPVYSGRTLTADQINLLSRWVEQGAQWQKHWSFIPPKQPELPTLKDKGWPRSPIDFFILERLEREGLKPSPQAEPTTLIRRVTLDLTGLPPSPAEVDAFLADKSPQAYEKLVDRLLQSPRYGERMAVPWLDGARYADTNGYQTDAERIMWRWRDWVIDAFNRNLPFDQFTTEQLAGDLLPGATLNQKLATGFNRNHRGNGEGGIIPEEYAVEYVVDRVETTATVWLGLTMGCARCHDHKYDPIAQKEFYQVFALFNNVPERGKAFKYGNSPPFLSTPTPEQQKELDALERKLAKAESDFKALKPQVTAAQMAWEKALNKTQPLHWGPSAGLSAQFPLDGSTAERVSESSGNRFLDGRFVDGEAEFAMGQTGLAASFDGKRFIEVGEVGNFGFYDRFSLGAWIRPRTEHGGTILSRTKETPEDEGYSLRLVNGKVQLNLVVRWLDDALRVETEQPLAPQQWHHVMATYDASRLADGVRIYVNGKVQELKVLLDELNQNFKSKEPFRIGGGGGPTNRFQGEIDEARVYPRVLSADEVKIAANSDSITAIATIPPKQRNDAQAAKIEAYFLEKHAPQPIQQARQRLLELQEEKQRLLDRVPTTMIMEEMTPPRETFVLQRGAYDRPGERVAAAGVPACLPPLRAEIPRNRLGFARWLVDPANPLTARVAVNRYWQMLFGTGLVKTVEDFGSQGEWPTHPELLDWLATEFVRTGWDVKQILKTIVMSATYRQSSRWRPELGPKDPDNRLLARGPRVRLSAEMVRDQALAISGLLVEKLGGPSVKPYQPAGVWKDLSGGEDYQPDSGESLYRRSLYTYWKRTAAPPVMINFDSAARETCVVRETRTNTPLQALNLMNDVTFVEASRVLAQRVMSEAGPEPEKRLELAFRLATARRPKPAERDILLAGLEQHLATYHKDPKAAVKLVGTGEFPMNEKLDVCELAAYTTLASLILNFDEVITKE